MRRKRWLVVVPVLGLLVVGAWWVFFRGPGVAALGAGEIHTVEVRFEPRGEGRAAAPVHSSDPEAIAALVAVLRSGEATEDHKCGSCGAITLRGPVGRSEELWFLPGHHAEWYEFRYAGRVYRSPRAEFVAAMRRIGVEVPLECS